MKRQVGWGIFGTGMVATAFAEGLRGLPDIRLAAVGSRDLERARGFAARWGAARACGDYAEVAADPAVDVVYVATPNHRHAPDSRLCLEAGKAVLCEKPFALDAAQAREVVDLARARGLFCMEGMWMRFMPAVRRLKRLVEEGAVGRVHSFAADLGFPVPRDPGNRFFDPALGGGALLDLGVYPLSLAFHLLGPPVRIRAQAGLASTGVDEQVAAVLGYQDGRLATVATSIGAQLPGEALVVGDRGSIRLHGPLYRPSRLSIMKTPPPPSGGRAVRLIRRALRKLVGRRPRTIYAPCRGNGYVHEAEEVVRCIQDGRLESEVMPLDETLAIMEAMDEIRRRWTDT